MNRAILIFALLAPTFAMAQATLPATTQSIDYPQAKSADAVVAQDGSGKYTTVLAAINASSQTMTPEKPWIIFVKPGTYRELIYVQREKRFTKLIGADAATTKITYDLYGPMIGVDGNPIGTYRTPTVQIDADDFTCENITFENAAGRKGQALALSVSGDRDVFRKCIFLGFQDTVFSDRNRQYFEDCDITGNTDFIFGGATDYFENCRIHAVGPGYLTASSTPDFSQYGFIFNHCTIDASQGVQTLLGRPWRMHANTVWLNTNMNNAIAPAGWNDWKKPHDQIRYAEFNSTGTDVSHRADFSKQLTADEAAQYTVQNVLGGADHWDPTKQ